MNHVSHGEVRDPAFLWTQYLEDFATSLGTRTTYDGFKSVGILKAAEIFSARTSLIHTFTKHKICGKKGINLMSMLTGKNLGSNAKSLLHVYQAQVLFKLQNAASFLVHLKSHKKAQV